MKNIKLITAFVAILLAQACAPNAPETTDVPAECPDPIVCDKPVTCPTCQICQTPPVCPPPVTCPGTAYVNPCASDPVGALGHYDDGHGVTFDAGGSVRLNGIAQQTLTFQVGQTVSEIRVRIVPKVHSNMAHVHVPALSMWRESVVAGGNIEEFVGRVEDPFLARSMDPNDATVANDYSQPHDLVLKVNEVSRAGVSYLVNVIGEWEESAGRGQAQDLTVCGTVAATGVDP